MRAVRASARRGSVLIARLAACGPPIDDVRRSEVSLRTCSARVARQTGECAVAATVLGRTLFPRGFIPKLQEIAPRRLEAHEVKQLVGLP